MIHHQLPVALGLLCFAIAPISSAQLPPSPLVQHGDTWRYRKGTSEPNADWASVPDASLDASWLSGPGGFGYGDGDDATVLADMENGYVTLYSRRSFDVTAGMDPARHLRLTVDYDDACIVFLDGQEVFRSSNIPGAPGTAYAFDQQTLSANHEASAGAGGSPAEVIDLGPLSGRLVTGGHVLSAQGINSGSASSDFSLIVDLDLVDAPPAPSDVTWTTADSPVNLTSNYTIDGGATLTIEAGVEVIMSAGTSITAAGGSHIDIAGTASAPVIIRAATASNWGTLSANGPGGTLTIRHADISGGQIRFLTGVTGLIEDSVIHDSSASSIINSVAASTVTMRRCRITNYAETLFRNTLTLIEHCLFEAPSADAVDFDAAVPGSTIRQCTFRNGPTGTNTDAIDIGPTGGVASVGVLIEGCTMHNFSDKGVSIGDGPDDAQDIVVRNCLIYNVARGVQIKHASVVSVEGCTIVDSAIGLHGFEKAGGTGGGIFRNSFNNILASNTDAIVLEDNSTLEIEYSNTQGSSWAGTGNIDADPLFRDPANRDYRLLAGSPCRGTGRSGDDMGIEYPVGGLPGIPRDLQVVAYDGSEATLFWTDPDDIESGFIIELSADGTNWAIAGTAPADTTGITVSSLDSNPSWLFRIRGTNFIGESLRSEVAASGVAPVDTDSDGMPDAWEELYADLDPGVPDGALDLDGDGSDNLSEFLASTDPSERDSVCQIDSSTELPSGAIQIQFAAQADKSYTVQYSDSLQPGSWQKLRDVPADPAFRPALTLLDSPPAGTRFRAYRLVTPPLPPG